jgi:hypothetical protein
MLDKLFVLAIKIGLGLFTFYFLYLLYTHAEKRIAEPKPKNIKFYLAYVYKMLFNTVSIIVFFVWTCAPLIGLILAIYLLFIK